ncbi:UDP-2,4-diacetamido-2,4,6-trideoxy-beta-L-altropyranose hydrolase [Pseudomonas corrugata]|uniref:UDP-2,4-diacetamido-2,4, 6-trideoxy-beta-L-altropyranose hydrolase n=1 Tax=Pseudomonas corrugata TaxID=47879 RepID=UPI0004647F4F|nr:UDP-2,4-diacetamido-2,4,6-trideoxy-beta-L-altropyranose hydrolase [Pseudomonas corrugata]
MKVVFRTDASLQMGSGHVMRCLTLAEALRKEGAECFFICREHSGNLLDFIQSKRFEVFALSSRDHVDTQVRRDGQLAHSGWLGATQAQDAKECESILEILRPDWLVVDHYALDARWEASLNNYFHNLLVIDDLADRKHTCNLLLDQNLGRTQQDYAGLVSDDCQVMAGAEYALLRPEFARIREQSLEKRGISVLQHVLITMGGVDQANATGAVLQSLKACSLPSDCRISVVMGMKSPHLALVEDVAASMAWPTEVLVNVMDMAERMASADLIIGAAGSTSWERCCLGVPTIMVVLADNQRQGAEALLHSGSVVLIEQLQDIPARLPSAILAVAQEGTLSTMSENARKVSDGLGIDRVIKTMSERNG